MAITQAICTSFLKELLEGQHNFNSAGGHTFKIALYTSAATLGASTTDYSVTNEVSGTGYSAGGATLTNSGVTISGDTAILDFSDITWSSSTITARGALIYNTTTDGGSGTTEAVCVLDFGTDKTTSGTDFLVQFPAALGTTAIIRIT